MATFVNPFHVTALKDVELPLQNPQNRKGTIWKMLDMDPRYLLSPADTLEMLSQLLVTTRFGFYDQYNTQDPTHVVDAYTFPTPYPDGARGPADANTVQSQIIVSVELIQPLIDGNLPAHTRRTTQVILGITVAVPPPQALSLRTGPSGNSSADTLHTYYIASTRAHGLSFGSPACAFCGQTVTLMEHLV